MMKLAGKKGKKVKVV